MGSYLSTTFLAPFAPTDTILKVFNKQNQRIFGINVCQYEKAIAEDLFLLVYVEDAAPKILDFDTAQDAEDALIIVQNAIDQLSSNCAFGASTPAAPPQTINAITLTQYKIQQAAATLIPLQWYDIADTAPIYNLGPTIRAQAKSTTDFEPSGVALSTNELVTINVLDDTIARRENTVTKTLAQNHSSITNTGSTYMQAVDFSTIVATGSSYIEAYNHSTLNVSGCSAISANNSVVTLVNANNVTINDITVNLTAFSGLVNDVIIDSSSSIGKLGRQAMTTANNQVLYAYVNTVELTTPTLTGSIVKKLDNAVPTANGEFRILVGSNLSGFVLTIQDSASTVLLAISSSMVGSTIVFRWNKLTSLFELVKTTSALNIVQLTVGSTGQTSFGSISPVPANPTTSELTVNGQVQTYGVLADYYIVSNTLFWNNLDFTLDLTDKLVLRYT